MDKADISWLLVSTLLVLMMAVPGLAMFYGGLVRSKNVLSVLLQVLCTFVLGLVLWFIYGYSSPSPKAMPSSVDCRAPSSPACSRRRTASTPCRTRSPSCCSPRSRPPSPASPARWLGSFAERARFSAVLVFTVIWFTFAYVPIAHMVWFASETAPGLLNARGALDFAGGTVVHINAGVAGLVGAM